MTESRRTFSGPIEQTPWPQRLPARAVTPGANPRLFGYDIRADLAASYAPHEVFLLSLLGELPSDAVSEAFRIAAIHLAPITIAEAPSHAACLAKLCGAGPTGYLGITTIALGELARHLVDKYEQLLNWLADPTIGAARFAPKDHDDRQAAAVLLTQIQATGLAVKGIDVDLDHTAAIYCVLHACGLVSREEWEIATVWAKWPMAMAEAIRVPTTAFTAYPMDVPPIVYSEEL